MCLSCVHEEASRKPHHFPIVLSIVSFLSTSVALYNYRMTKDALSAPPRRLTVSHLPPPLGDALNHDAPLPSDGNRRRPSSPREGAPVRTNGLNGHRLPPPKPGGNSIGPSSDIKRRAGNGPTSFGGARGAARPVGPITRHLGGPSENADGASERCIQWRRPTGLRPCPV